MHERSLMQSLLKQVHALAAEHPGSRVLSIRVRIGEFSGVEPDLLESSYLGLAEHTPLQDAKLMIEKVSLNATCRKCGHDFLVKHFHFQCPVCSGVELDVCGGEELLLESVVMEETSHDQELVS